MSLFVLWFLRAVVRPVFQEFLRFESWDRRKCWRESPVVVGCCCRLPLSDLDEASLLVGEGKTVRWLWLRGWSSFFLNVRGTVIQMERAVLGVGCCEWLFGTKEGLFKGCSHLRKAKGRWKTSERMDALSSRRQEAAMPTQSGCWALRRPTLTGNWWSEVAFLVRSDGIPSWLFPSSQRVDPVCLFSALFPFLVAYSLWNRQLASCFFGPSSEFSQKTKKAKRQFALFIEHLLKFYQVSFAPNDCAIGKQPRRH